MTGNIENAAMWVALAIMLHGCFGATIDKRVKIEPSPIAVRVVP
jgi:hypothetical protein